MFKTHSNLNASPDRSHCLWVPGHGRRQDEGGSHKIRRGASFGGDRDHREPAGHRGEGETGTDGKGVGCCRNRTPDVLQSPHSGAEHDTLG